MPHEFQHPYHRDPDDETSRPTPHPVVGDAAPGLAQFALLADPATISGQATGSEAGTAFAEVLPVVEAENPRADAGLLDAATARRLAEEVQARQRASRAALEAARERNTKLDSPCIDGAPGFALPGATIASVPACPDRSFGIQHRHGRAPHHARHERLRRHGRRRA